MFHLYIIVVLGGRYAEGECHANDMEQSAGRVFQSIARIVEATPWLASEARITQNCIEFTATGSTITAKASDYAGSAGGSQSITSFTELWAYTQERARRLWDETVPVPTKQVSVRIVDTYSGFENESELLLELYKTGLKGTVIAPDLYAQPGMLMYWSHQPRAPWQTPEWLQSMRTQLRPNAYLRMIENRWVSGEESFVDAEQWQRCIDPDARPVIADSALQVWLALDASVTSDFTAIVGTTWDQQSKQVRLVYHRIFQPTRANPIDFERDVEGTLLDLKRRFAVREVRYDPFQMAASAQRLIRAGVPMVAFPQTVSNLTESSNNLFELIRGGNLRVYDDAALNKAVAQTVAVESARGWRLAKEKTSSRIDVVVALAMAALPTVQLGQSAPVNMADAYVPDASERAAALDVHLREMSAEAGFPSPWDGNCAASPWD
jgi:phage terminase large subunit-like protein